MFPKLTGKTNMNKLLLSLTFSLFLLIGFASSQANVNIMNSTMPSPIRGSSCVEDSSTNLIYCFGGSFNSGRSDQIIKYIPSTDQISILSTTMPYQTSYQSCVENSATHKIYCFGGVNNNHIFEFNPSNNNLIGLPPTLPSNLFELSCVEDSSTNLIYCFGGEPITSAIWEFNPSTYSLTQLPINLPFGVASLSCEEDSNTNGIYCFGGRDNSGNTAYNKIFKFTPSSNTLIQLSETLPFGRYAFSCKENSLTNKINCLGGATGGTSVTDQIISFDPSTFILTTSNINIPTPRTTTGCEIDSSTQKTYCFGGRTTNLVLLNEIIEFSPSITGPSTNQPPALDPIGPQQIQENQTLTIQLTATDPNNDTLTFLTDANSVLTSQFSFNNTSGLFEWTPTYLDQGTYNVTFYVTDGTFVDSETVTFK